MFSIGDYVVYKRDVCKIIDITSKKVLNMQYYKLAPISDDSLIIEVPTDNNFGNIRKIISKKDAIKLINNIASIPPIEKMPDKMYENEYKRLLSNNNHEDLIKIIKTTYTRNANRVEAHKKEGEKDKNYFNIAETLLYNELSIALNKSYDETKEYIIGIVNKSAENKNE
jgi:CarD family transcriptional regulator